MNTQTPGEQRFSWEEEINQLDFEPKPDTELRNCLMLVARKIFSLYATSQLSQATLEETSGNLKQLNCINTFLKNLAQRLSQSEKGNTEEAVSGYTDFWERLLYICKYNELIIKKENGLLIPDSQESRYLEAYTRFSDSNLEVIREGSLLFEQRKYQELLKYLLDAESQLTREQIQGKTINGNHQSDSSLIAETDLINRQKNHEQAATDALDLIHQLLSD